MNKLEKRNIRDILALTPMQAGMLFHYLKAPDRDFYANRLTLEISAKIDRVSVKKAWNFVIKTNEMLRTVFRWEKLEKPSQAVLKNHTVNFRFKDLAAIEDEREKQAQWRKIKAEEEKYPFDLRDVAFRVLLCRVSEQRFYLVISNHHILYDGWSTGIILREFLGAYEAFRQGDQPPSPPARPRFKDFIRWQQTQDQEKQKHFWRQYLEGFEPQPPLPGKGIHRDQAEEKENSVRLVLAKETKDRLEYFAQQKRVTLAAVFYGAWAVLLQKYHCREDVVFGTIVSGRSVPLPGIENLVGLLINTLPLRAGTTPGESLLDFLRKINNHLAERKPYENTPLPDIPHHRQQKPGVDSERFDSIIAIENWPLESYLNEVKSQLSITSYRMEEKPHYDLTLVISPFDDIEIEFLYNNASLAKASVVRLADHFRRILDALPSHLSLRVREMEILSPEEKYRLLVVFNETGGTPAYSPDRTIHRLFLEQVERSPDHVALIGQIPNSEFQNQNACGDVQVTYSEFDRRSSQLAYGLREKGVTTDTIVATMVERSLEMVSGILGILKAGGAYLPLDPAYPADRVKYILSDSGAKLFIITRSQAREDYTYPGTVFLDFSTLPPFHSSSLHSSHLHPSPSPATSLAYVIYTSGSTGKPKGVLVQHPAAVNLLHALQNRYPLNPDDTYLLKTSYLFDVSVTELFGWFPGGGRLALLEPGGEKDPVKILAAIARERVTHINFVPSMFNVFLEALHQGNRGKWSRLKYMFLAGEALLPGLVERFRALNTGIRLENIYGPTEAAVYSSWYSLSGWNGEGSIPIGKPLPGVTLYILAPWDGLQPIAVPGELCIGGKGLARGYLNRPELTGTRFLPEKTRSYKSYRTYISKKIYRTGDLARWLEDGNIEFLGRLDFQVKIRGFRIELGEIENRLLEHPRIKEAVVTSRVSQERTLAEHFLCAYVILDSPGTFKVSRLRAYLQGRLPGYMVPAFFVELGAMPLTPTGKVDRKSLPGPEITPAQEYTAPRNTRESALVEIWAKVLGIENQQIGIDNNFFEMGGHSLKAIGLINRIHKTFDLEIPMSGLFNYPTIRAMALYLDKIERKQYSAVEPVEKKEYHELSTLQKRFFIFQHLESGETSYHISETMLLEGPVSKEKFAGIFKRMIRRHESLRTSFHLVNGEPLQRIHDEADFEIEYYELIAEYTREGNSKSQITNKSKGVIHCEKSPLGSGELNTDADQGPKSQELRAKSYINGFRRPFNLARAPLVRMGLIKVESGKHFLIFDIHHIITDGVSMGIIIKEFLALYAGEELLPLRVQYKEYVEWKRKRKKKEAAPGTQPQETALNLPLDFPRPATPDFKGKTIEFVIDELGRLSTLLSLQEDLTLYMVLLAAFNVFLAKISGQENIVVGSPIAGRQHDDLEGIIGLFINTLVLQNFPAGHKRFSDFLSEVKNNALEAFENQDFQYDALAERAVSGSGASHKPLYDVMFVLQNMEMPEMEIPGLKVIREVGENLTAKFAVTLYYEEFQTAFKLEYSTALFKVETIERFIGYFRKIIFEILEDPHQKIEAIDILSAAERHYLLYDFNDTEVPFPREKTIYQLIQEQAERTPDPIALAGPGKTLPIAGSPPRGQAHPRSIQLTYRELNHRSHRLAHKLRGSGVLPGKVVAVLLERSLEMVVGIQAILKAGGAYLPIDPEYPDSRIASILEDSRASLLLTAGHLSSPSFLKQQGIKVMLVDSPAEEPDSAPGENLPPASGPGDPIYLIFTSGSTGKPKGAGVYHRGFMNLVHWFVTAFELEARDRNLLLTSLSFDLTQKNLYAPLLKGGMISIPGPGYFEPAVILRELQQGQVTWINCTPSMFYQLVQYEETAGKKQLASLRYVFLGGEPISFTTLIQWLESGYHRAQIVNTYGPTECTDICAAYRVLEPRRFLQETIPLGPPVYNVQLFVVDKNHRLVPVGVEGELLIGGEGVGLGYVKDRELTSQKFIRHSFGPGDPERLLYKTGDLVKWLPGGNLEFSGRIDHQVKIRGFRIEPGEIENQVLNHPEVKEALVMARQGGSGDKYLCAYLVPHNPGTFRLSSLQEWLTGELPHYMVPAYFIILEKMPLNPHGKVDRQALPEPGPDSERGYAPPRNETENTLVKIWSQVLGVDRKHLGVEDDFFRLGGHSLSATALVGQIYKAFSVEIPIAELFKKPTVRAISYFILQRETRVYSSIQPVEKREYYALSPGQVRLFILRGMDPREVAYNISSAIVLAGKVETGRMQDVFKQLIRRHESLRTSFPTIAGNPVQRIHDALNFEIGYYDLTAEDKEEENYKQIPNSKSQITNKSGGVIHREKLPLGSKELNTVADQDPKSQELRAKSYIKHFIRAFDLSQAPLLRVGLVKIGEEKHLFMVDMHHIIADGISISIFMKDFMTLYRGKDLTPQKIQYRDFVIWQKEKKQKEKIARQESYWLKQWEDEIPILNLPCDYPRPSLQSFAGHAISFELEENQARALKSMASEQDVTLFMLLLSVYTTFLSRLSNQEDIVVGTPTAGRWHADLENIMGMFVNTMALRNFPISLKPFKDFLVEVKNRTLDAFENQDYPFEELVEKAEPEREPSRNPLFDTMLVLQNMEAAVLEIPGLKCVPLDYETHISKFDLTLIVIETGVKFLFIFEYCTMLFKKERIERFIHYLKRVFTAVLKNRSVKPVEIEIIPEEEKLKILYDFNDTIVGYPKDKTVHRLFLEQVEQTPDHLVLKENYLVDRINKKTLAGENIQLSYKELDEKSNRLGYLLREKGVGPDTIISIIMATSIDMVIGIFAILKAGAAYLPIDASAPRERINYMLADSGAKIVIAAKGTGGMDDMDDAETRDGTKKKTGLRREMVYVPFSFPMSSKTLETGSGDAGFHGQLAYIIYTSGSTGRPKGVMVDHCALVNLCTWHNRYYSVTSRDKAGKYAAASFDASIWEIFPYLLAGASLYLIPDDIKLDMAALNRYLETHDITIAFLPTPVYEQFKELENHCLRVLLTGGDRLKSFVKRDYRLYNNYGPTENTVVATAYPVTRSSGIIPIGKPIHNNRIFILSPSYYQVQPIGVPGELFIGGAGIARGYLNNPELTAEKFDHDLLDYRDYYDQNNQPLLWGGQGGGGAAHPPYFTGDRCRLQVQVKNWRALKTEANFIRSGLPVPPPGRRRQKIYRTGDLARWLMDGNIEFLGRLDFQVKIRGFRIELGEIESHLLKHPQVKEAVVIARDGKDPDKYLCAYIRPGDMKGVGLEAAVLRDYLSGLVPDYMIPAYFVQLEKIPLTPSGKVDRQALPAPGPVKGHGFVAPRDKIEKKLVNLWSELLGIDSAKISIDDNFFHLGGHSLKATVLVSRVHREFNVNIPLGQFFKISGVHIRGLAESIKRTARSAPVRFIAIEPGEAREYYPLSPAQQRLYILQQLDKQEVSYNMPAVWQVEGKPEIKKIKEVFHQLIRRHESLRTSFARVKDEPVQRIHQVENYKLQITNYKQIPNSKSQIPTKSERGMHREKLPLDTGKINTGTDPDPKSYIKDFICPFDLSRVPLFRVGLAEIGEEKHLLMVDLHHIISDGISIDVLVKEFLTQYRGKELAPLKLQYKDFSQWQQGEIVKSSLQRQSLYWQKQFREELPVLDLPADFPRPPVRSFEGNSLGFEVGSEEAQGLRRLAREKGTTLFMLLLSVFNVLLSRLTNQESIVVGTAAAGRRHADLEPLIGMFVNTLALLHYPRGHKCFDDFLREVKEKTLAAFENQDYPFEELVKSLDLERYLHRNPVFDVMFTHQAVHSEEFEIPGLLLKPLDFRTGISKFDLMLLVEEGEENLSFTVEYSTELFKEETIHRFIGYFKAAAAEVVRAPGIKLSGIEIIAKTEREQLLYRFNNTVSIYPKGQCLAGLFEQEVRRYPDTVALVFAGQYLTYRELAHQADRLAGVLQTRGVGPEVRVGIMSDASLEMIIAVLGVIKAGGAYLSIAPDYPEERIEYMLADSNATILLKANELSSWFSAHPSSFIETPHYCKNLAYIIYTSGSIGRPKGVMVEHINVVRLVKNTDYIQFNAGDRLLQTGALEFDASTFEIWGSLLNGLTLYLAPKEKRLNPAVLKSLIARNDIAVMWMTAPLFNRMVDSDIYLFRGLRTLLVGGDVLSPSHIGAVRRRFPGLRLSNGYGPTENTTFSTTFSIEREYKTGIPIGKPIANSTAYIVDKNGNLQPLGVFGELWVGGDGVSRGYLNDPELTKKKFLRGADAVFSKRAPALYKTGDLARWLPDGNIEFLGRMDKQVKIRGYRIEPGEIENHLMKHEQVKEAVVMVRTDRSGEKYLCAYAVGKPGGSVPVWREYLSGVVPAYMVPSYFVILESIPLTSNGKVDWRSLPEPAVVSPTGGFASPRNPLEKKLVEIWTEVLGIGALPGGIGIDDNFFELGGHSLKAALLVSKIHQVLDVDLPLSDVFTKPHIRGLSSLIINMRREVQQGDFISLEPVEKREYYKLSSMQARLYVLQGMEVGIGYNIPSFWIIEGHGGPARFEIVFRQLNRRHESLRTSFHLVKDEPVQRVHDTVNFEIEGYDLTAEDKTHAFPKSQELRAKSYIKSFIRPFDLSQAPLLRVGLAEIGEEKHVLMVDLHHIIADGTSVRVLIEDFMRAYQGDALAGQKIQYKDFVAWQGNQKEKRGQAGTYWLKQFAGELPVLNLPADYARPLLQGFEGRTFSFEVEEEQYRALKSLARQQEVTLFMLLLGIYTGFLSRLSGQEDIVIGTPIAGRRHADLENILGMFVNTLALRNFPLDQKPFNVFLAEVKERSLDAFENQDFPFEELVEQVEVERDTSRNPLFDTMFILQNIDYPVIEIPGLKLTPYAYESHIAKFDLTLTAMEAGEKLTLLFEYSTHLFKEKTIERLSHYFMNALAAVIAHKRIKLGEIEILPEEEKQRILIDFNDTAAAYAGEKCLHQLFEEQVERSPDHVALVGGKEERLKGRRVEGKKKEESCGQVFNACGGVQVTYREVKKRANGLADGLKEKGVQPGTIVGIRVERSIEMVLGILGILKAGGAYLPIDPNYPEDRVNYLLADSGAKLLITTRSQAQEDNTYRETVFLDFSTLPPYHSSILHSSHLHLSPSPATSLAYVIYTSGSTGRPKGVMVQEAAVVNLLYALQNRYPLTPHDTYLLKTSYMFDVSVTELFGWFMEGGRLAVLEPGSEKDPGTILETIEKQQVTHINFVPSMFNIITGALHPGNVAKLRGLKYIFLAGEALLAGPVERFFRLNSAVLLENLYGPTEAVVYASWYSLSGWTGAGTIPIGQALPNVTLYILDRQNNLQPIGVPGELCIGGAGLARGYLNQPELTKERFCLRRPRTFLKKGSWTSKNFLLDYSPLTTHHSPIYRSGDLARWIEDGNIEFLGRIDFQVKIRGFRIELGEIETRLLEHPQVQEAVVIAREGQETDKDLCAYVRLREEAPQPEPGLLKGFLSDLLPGYMIPYFFVYLDKIPLTSSGKIDRNALPAPGVKIGEDYVAPRDEIEKKLVALWSEVLGIASSKISIDANFFHLGGHSLTAALLVSRIQRELAVKISLSEIFKPSTSQIRGLARHIKKSMTPGPDRYLAIPPVEEKEYYVLSSPQARLYALQQVDPQAIGYNMPAIWQVEGTFTVEKLTGIFQQLVRRHESLRTSFRLVENEPVQRVHEVVNFEAEYHELGKRQDARGNREEPMPDAIIKSFIRPFDLSQAPLLRVGLIRIRAETFFLMVDMHHIISDGTSIALLMTDFVNASRDAALPFPVIRFKDFAQWQNSREQREIIKQQEKYWLEQFREEPPVLNLPYDYPRPLLQGFAGKVISFALNQKETSELRSLARQQEVTLFMLLLPVYAIFLSRLSDQEDLVVGIPTAGRRQPDLEPVIGMFVNTLALRNFPNRTKGFSRLVNQEKERMINAFENQDYPLEDLVEQLGLQRDVSRSPLFDTMFILQNLDFPTIETPGLKLTPYPYENSTAKFDLTLVCIEEPDHISCLFEYSTHLFKAGTIARFISYWKNILSAVKANPGIRLADIDILSEQEKKQLLLDFNDTGEDFPTSMTIYQLFEEQVDRCPDQVVLVGPKLQNTNYKPQFSPALDLGYLSFRELDERANRLAHYLRQEKGVDIGDRIVVLLERSVELITALMGVMKAGAAYVPLDPRQPVQRLRVVCRDASIGIVISQGKSREKFHSLVQSEVPGFLALVCLDEEWTAIHEQPFHRPGITGAGNPAYVMYTSGSSGTPKGVVVEHRTIVNTLNWRKNFYDYHPGDVSLQNPPYFFDSSVTDIFTPILGGARLVIITEEERTDSRRLGKIIKNHRVSHLIFIPAFYNVLLEEIAPDMTGIRVITAAGEHFPDGLVKKHFEKLPRVRIFNEYGPTENSVNTTVYELKPGSEKALIGIPISNVGVYILDRYSALCPLGVGGEMCLAGASLARGYLNNPELTSEKFNKKLLRGVQGGGFLEKSPPGRRRQKIYKTGDLGRWLADGNLEFLGRVDTQVKIRGIRVEPGEIENHLLSRGDLKEAVVLALDGAGGEKYLCAYLVFSGLYTKEDEKGMISALRAYLGERVPQYMIPSYFVPIDGIPLTSSGKIDRKVLPDPAPNEGGDFTAPRNEIESKVVDIWQQVLGKDEKPVGIDDNFFIIGGDSIKAIRIISRLHNAGYKTDMKTLFQYPTIRELASRLGQVKTVIARAPDSFKSWEERLRQYVTGEESLEVLERLNRQYPGAIADLYPLTPMQQGMLFHTVSSHAPGAYFQQTSYRLQGELEVKMVERSLNELFKRHDILRTVFVYQGVETPFQVVLQERQVDFYYEDLREIIGDSETKEQWIKEFMTKDKLRGFDLGQDVLMRLSVLQTGERENAILWSSHHILMDGWCIGILNKEFFEIYTRLLEGGEPRLSPVTPYRNYIRWLGKQNREMSRDYWQRYLESYEEAVFIPGLKPRPDLTVYKNETLVLDFDREKTLNLTAAAGKNHVTLNTVIQTLWAIILGKYNGREDVVFGSVVSGRPAELPGVETMVGLFINTIPVRVRFMGHIRFRHLLQRVQAEALASEPHHYHPLAEIQAQSQLKKDLLNHIFVFENYPLAEQITGYENMNNRRHAFHVSHVEAFGQTNYDFNVIAVGGDRLVVNFNYNGMAFDSDWVGRMANHFRLLVEQVLVNEEIEIGDLTLLSKQEKQQLVEEFNQTTAWYPRDITIQQLFAAQVARTPDHAALVGTAQGTGHKTQGLENHGEDLARCTITYRGLHEKADQVARVLLEKGVGPDAIVGIMLGRSLEMIIGILGILKAGAAYMPMDADYPAERIDFMLKDSSAKLLLTAHDIRFLSQDNILTPEAYKTCPEGTTSHQHLSLWVNAPVTSLAYIIYTSGTTGMPKGTMLTQRNVVQLMACEPSRFDFHARDAWSLFHSFCFDFSVWEMYGALLFGGKSVLVDKTTTRDPAAFLKLLKREQVTVLNQTPSAFYGLSYQEMKAPGRELNVRWVIFGGEALKPTRLKEWQEKYPGARLINMFGITETTVHVTFKEISRVEIQSDTSNIGTALAPLRVYVMDKNLETVPAGVPGECVVGGPGVARGYINRPQLTREKFIANPFNPGEILYRSGDLVRRGPGGELEYLGRIDHQVKIRGFRIELGEIENRVKTHPGVEEAIVINRSVRGREYLCAYVVINSEPGHARPSPPELKEYLEGKLPDYMIPACFVEIEQIPLSSNGKTDRRQLPQPLESDFHSGETHVSPTTDLQRKISETWQEVLGREKVGIDDNFFDLGGNSLDFIKISFKLKEKLDREISVVTLLTYPTIRSLERYLTRQHGEEAGGSELIDEGKDLMHLALQKLDSED